MARKPVPAPKIDATKNLKPAPTPPAQVTKIQQAVQGKGAAGPTEMSASHSALVNARAALADIDARIKALDADHVRATRELEEADVELTRQLGAEQIGEADLAALSKARSRHEAAALAVRSIAAGRGVLTERRPAAQLAIEQASQAFYDQAATALGPEHDRLRRRLQELTTELQSTLTAFARCDAIVARIPIGTRTGASLLRAAGLEERSLEISIGREPPRMTEAEILARFAPEAEAAE